MTTMPTDAAAPEAGPGQGAMQLPLAGVRSRIAAVRALAGQHWQVIANLAIKGSGALLAIATQFVIVRILGPAAYGDFAVFITAAALLLAMSRLGMDVIVVRRTAVLFADRHRRGLIRFLRRAAIHAFVGTGLACAVFLLLRPLLPPQAFAPGIGLMFAAVLAMTLLSVLASGLRGMQGLLLADALDSVVKPLVLLCIAAAASLVLPRPEVGPAAFVMAHALVVLLVAAAITKRVGGLPPGGDTRHVHAGRVPTSEMLQLTAIALLGYSFSSLDTLLVAHYVSAEHTGAYSAACSLVRSVLLIPFILALRMQPRMAVCFARRDYRNLHRTFTGVLFASLAAALSCGLLLACIGRLLLQKMAPEFVVAYPALLLLSVAHVINSALMVLSMALSMCGQQRLVFSSSIVGVLVVVPLYYALIPRLHLAGAALGVLAGVTVNMLVLSVLARRWKRQLNDALLGHVPVQPAQAA